MIGFVLQATYRVRNTRSGRVPVVHLYGRLADGAAFLVQDDRQTPFFFVRQRDAEAAGALGADPMPTDRRNFAGEPMARVAVQIPADVPPLRDRLQAAGIEAFEADVRFATRYLIERGIKGGCAIEGEHTVDADGLRVFHNPSLRPIDAPLMPRVLSFDIETDPRASRLLAISLYAPQIDEVLIVDGSGREMPERSRGCASEYAALELFCRRVREVDPDVLTGWNIIDFDLSVLEQVAQRVGHPLNLGLQPGSLRIRKAQGYFGSGQASIPGRLVLDGIDLMRGAFIRQDEYSLDFVARAVLGQGKAVAGSVKDRVQEIIDNYRHDLPAFANYARTDARLAYQIVEKLNLVALSVARSRLTGMTPDRVAASIASFDFLYLCELAPAGIVAPSVRGTDADAHSAQTGGHVLEPLVGLHSNVWVFDFKSLYPSIIRTFNIDPVAFVPDTEAGENLIETPGGRFRREPAILPRLLDRLVPQREAAKRRGDGVAAHAIKILMNSFYGVLGTPACRFFNPALANAITGMGKELLLWSKRWFETAGYTVLYGDTDSLFVSAGEADPAAAQHRAATLVKSMNAELATYIAGRWRVASRMELEFEKLYLRLFLPHARHSTRGASKRYAGLVHGPGGEVEFIGMEVVRRDWTPIAKRVQRELFERLFTDRPVDAYLAEVVREVRNGRFDAELVYQKNLRRGIADYTETTPPHVVAARKLGQPAGRSIRYVMTTAGAEPADHIEHPLDREHYVAKQIRPVAESVLEVLALDFDRVIGDTRQFELSL